MIDRGSFRDGIDWQPALSHLDERGFAVIPSVLIKKTCDEIIAIYADDRRFRSRIEMSRYAFGQGEYKYFNYPLPRIVEQLRSFIYPHLVPLANEWIDRLGKKQPHYPEKLSDFTEQCHRAGQKRATLLPSESSPGSKHRSFRRPMHARHFFSRRKISH